MNYIYIVVLLTVITLPINYYTQRGWHIPEILKSSVCNDVFRRRVAVIYRGVYFNITHNTCH